MCCVEQQIYMCGEQDTVNRSPNLRKNQITQRSDNLEERCSQSRCKAKPKNRAISEPSSYRNGDIYDINQSKHSDNEKIKTSNQNDLACQTACQTGHHDQQDSALQVISNNPEVDETTSKSFTRSEYTIHRGKRNYLQNEAKFPKNGEEKDISPTHDECKHSKPGQQDLPKEESDNPVGGAVGVIDESLSSLQTKEPIANNTTWIDVVHCDGKRYAEEHQCQEGSNCQRGNKKLTNDDYRKIKKTIFGSKVGPSVVVISLEKDKIDIHVGTGALKEMESFLAASFGQSCFRDIFDVTEGASVKLAVLLSTNAEKDQINKSLVVGDSLSQIKAGLRISSPDDRKVKAIPGDKWEYKEGVNTTEVDWRCGTVGAICEDKNTHELYLLTAGHVFQQKWGFLQETAFTHCKLLNAEKTQMHYISNGFVSFMGQDEDENAVDVAAIPLFQNYQDKKYVTPFFGHGLSPDGKHIQDKEDIKVSVFTGPSVDLIGRCVQKRGAVTGYTRGKIIKTNVDVQIEVGGVKKEVSNCILVESEKDEKFADSGDSGSLIIDDQQDSGNGKKAIGIFFCILEGWKHKPNQSLAVCVRLDKSLEVLNREAQNLDLQFYNPSPKESISVSHGRNTCKPKSLLRSKSENIHFPMTDNDLSNGSSSGETSSGNNYNNDTEENNNSAVKRRSWGASSSTPSKQSKSYDAGHSVSSKSTIMHEQKGNVPKKYDTFPFQSFGRRVSEPCTDENYGFYKRGALSLLAISHEQ